MKWKLDNLIDNNVHCFLLNGKRNLICNLKVPAFISESTNKVQALRIVKINEIDPILGDRFVFIFKCG